LPNTAQEAIAFVEPSRTELQDYADARATLRTKAFAQIIRESGLISCTSANVNLKGPGFRKVDFACAAALDAVGYELCHGGNVPG
jgi:hypothetical protein